MSALVVHWIGKGTRLLILLLKSLGVLHSSWDLKLCLLQSVYVGGCHLGSCVLMKLLILRKRNEVKKKDKKIMKWNANFNNMKFLESKPERVITGHSRLPLDNGGAFSNNILVDSRCSSLTRLWKYLRRNRPEKNKTAPHPCPLKNWLLGLMLGRKPAKWKQIL